jgi:D-aminopeptidase
LRTFMRERLFEPLGLSDTDLVPSDFEIGAGMATLHVPMPDGSYRRGIFPSEEVLGEGGITSTVDDMLKWVAHLRDPSRFGSVQTWREMFKPTTLNNGFVIDYSLGLMRYTHRGIETICHAGGVIGGGGQMLTVPAKELDIVVLNNTGGIDPAQLTFKIVSLLLQDEGLLDETPTVSAKAFAPLVGRKFHSRDSGLFLAFEDKEGVLCASAFNSPGNALVDKGDALVLEFHNLAVGPFEFDKVQCANQSEPPMALRVVNAGTPMRVEGVDPILDLQGPAAGLVGTYACPDMAATAVVVRKGDELRLKLQGEYGRNEVVLESFTGGVFTFKPGSSDIPTTGIVETEQVNGQISALLLSTTRSSRLRLTRVPGSTSAA